ncbi:hypothetical protein MOQ19_09570 [Stenotrophomonas maltophilia]|nr:hypothetical protein [Stenotrophomonas maltophilia]
MDLRKRINWGTVFVYVALITIGFAAALGMLGLTGQINFGKDAPAWVQAIGSIVAILIAVAVPATQHFLSSRKQQQESLDKARSLGLLLLPAIRTFGERNHDIWEFEHPDDGVEDLRVNACIAGSRAIDALEIPAIISARIDELHALGPAASGIQRAVFNVVAAAEFVVEEDFVRFDGMGTELESTENVIFDKARFYELMWDALRGLTDSQNKIEGMLGHTMKTPSARSG